MRIFIISRTSSNALPLNASNLNSKLLFYMFYFKFLKNLADENGLVELSMGMSSDYMTAIKCGATYVRVGTAIFGLRQ